MKTGLKILECILLISVVWLFVCFILSLTNASSNNVTNEYILSQKLTSFESSEEAIAYLNENKISYTLTNSTIEVKLQYSSYFTSKSRYTIENNKLVAPENLQLVAKLDDSTNTNLKVETTNSRNGYSTRISFKDSTNEYYKLDGQYYVKDVIIFPAFFSLYPYFLV